MRLGVLFRICRAAAAVLLVLAFARPAHALWLDVGGEPYPIVAPLVVKIDAVKPSAVTAPHGFFTVPPAANPSEPRLRVQYRADFPLSITVETSGALVGDHDVTAGALSLTTRIVLLDRWWLPQLNASLADLNLEGMLHGRVEAGGGGLRTEWKLKF